MTPRDISHSTGISLQTIYKHLHNGKLDGEWSGTRWNVPAWEVVSWSRYLFREGRCYMYPPQFTLKFIEDFNLK